MVVRPKRAAGGRDARRQHPRLPLRARLARPQRSIGKVVDRADSHAQEFRDLPTGSRATPFVAGGRARDTRCRRPSAASGRRCRRDVSRARIHGTLRCRRGADLRLFRKSHTPEGPERLVFCARLIISRYMCFEQDPPLAAVRRRFPPFRRKASGLPKRRETMTPAMLEIRKLRKTFGELVAVDDVSFTVGKGELVGLLGPNGAGKTTTVSMITGLVLPDRGDVLIHGAPLGGDTDPKKRQIGLVPQDLALYDELSAVANLRFFGALYDLTGKTLDEAIRSSLQLVGLGDRDRDAVKTFSGGMKRRLNLAAGLLHNPDILLLDEPTAGVDPQSRNAIFDNLEQLKSRGTALLYTTHYMEEAERLADRIVIVDHGSVVADDTLAGLQSRVATVAGGAATLESVFLTLTGRSLRD